jgi:hypothetical protein
MKTWEKSDPTTRLPLLCHKFGLIPLQLTVGACPARESLDVLEGMSPESQFAYD